MTNLWKEEGRKNREKQEWKQGRQLGDDSIVQSRNTGGSNWKERGEKYKNKEDRLFETIWLLQSPPISKAAILHDPFNLFFQENFIT